MASSNPDVNKRVARSALLTLLISLVGFYLGDRYGEALAGYSGQAIEHWGDAFSSMWPLIMENPTYIDMSSTSILIGLGVLLVVWLVWLRYVAFIGNFRAGEESGSARWGTLKEGKAFKDETNEDNNLIFTQNFGLALKRPKFDPELDRNLNVLVVGGSGSGKTFNYVTPNICQLNTSYFVTDPKGTLLQDAGFLFTDNGYRLKSFNTISFDESMHYNPLKYVRTDTDILSFVNCFIMNTNGDGKASDPFWENSERMLYTALIALLRDWFPEKDYNLPSLLTLLSMAEARENDENYKSPLDLLFLQIEEGKRYIKSDGGTAASTPTGLSRSFATGGNSGGWSWVPSKFKRNSDGVRPADCGGLSADQDFALLNYKNFKTAAGKTLKSIIISCNVRLAPIATEGIKELLSYDEMEIDTLGDPGAKVAIFGILSDTDKTFSFLFAVLMWQTIDQLCRKALTHYGGKLPTPVHFIFDEFANIGQIPQIEETIAVTRSRNIGITIILQSMAQLESKYDKKAKTIIDCCDTTLFLGGKSNSTNKEIAEMIGKQTINQMTYNESTGQSSSASKNLQIQGRDLIDAAEIGKMSRKKAILLIAGTNPLMDDKFDPHTHRRYCYIVDKRNKKRIHGSSFDFKRFMVNGFKAYDEKTRVAERIVFDTETTGLRPGIGKGDEILTISILDGKGNVLLDTKYRPRWNKRWDKATKVNGIRPEDVEGLPTIEGDVPRIRELVLCAREIVGYNVSFDLGFLKCLGIEPRAGTEVIDTMQTFSSFVRRHGESIGLSEDQLSRSRFKLTEAADIIGYELNEDAHSSLHDALATLAIENFIKSYQPPEEGEAAY